MIVRFITAYNKFLGEAANLAHKTGREELIRHFSENEAKHSLENPYQSIWTDIQVCADLYQQYDLLQKDTSSDAARIDTLKSSLPVREGGRAYSTVVREKKTAVANYKKKQEKITAILIPAIQVLNKLETKDLALAITGLATIKNQLNHTSVQLINHVLNKNPAVSPLKMLMSAIAWDRPLVIDKDGLNCLDFIAKHPALADMIDSSLIRKLCIKTKNPKRMHAKKIIIETLINNPAFWEESSVELLQNILKVYGSPRITTNKPLLKFIIEKLQIYNQQSTLNILINNIYSYIQEYKAKDYFVDDNDFNNFAKEIYKMPLLMPGNLLTALNAIPLKPENLAHQHAIISGFFTKEFSAEEANEFVNHLIRHSELNLISDIDFDPEMIHGLTRLLSIPLFINTLFSENALKNSAPEKIIGLLTHVPADYQLIVKKLIFSIIGVERFSFETAIQFYQSIPEEKRGDDFSKQVGLSILQQEKFVKIENRAQLELLVKSHNIKDIAKIGAHSRLLFDIALSNGVLRTLSARELRKWLLSLDLTPNELAKLFNETTSDTKWRLEECFNFSPKLTKNLCNSIPIEGNTRDYLAHHICDINWIEKISPTPEQCIEITKNLSLEECENLVKKGIKKTTSDNAKVTLAMMGIQHPDLFLPHEEKEYSRTVDNIINSVPDNKMIHALNLLYKSYKQTRAATTKSKLIAFFESIIRQKPDLIESQDLELDCIQFLISEWAQNNVKTPNIEAKKILSYVAIDHFLNDLEKPHTDLSFLTHFNTESITNYFHTLFKANYKVEEMLERIFNIDSNNLDPVRVNFYSKLLESIVDIKILLQLTQDEYHVAFAKIENLHKKKKSPAKVPKKATFFDKLNKKLKISFGEKLFPSNDRDRFSISEILILNAIIKFLDKTIDSSNNEIKRDSSDAERMVMGKKLGELILSKRSPQLVKIYNDKAEGVKLATILLSFIETEKLVSEKAILLRHAALLSDHNIDTPKAIDGLLKLANTDELIAVLKEMNAHKEHKNICETNQTDINLLDKMLQHDIHGIGLTKNNFALLRKAMSYFKASDIFNLIEIIEKRIKLTASERDIQNVAALRLCLLLNTKHLSYMAEEKATHSLENNIEKLNIDELENINTKLLSNAVSECRKKNSDISVNFAIKILKSDSCKHEFIKDHANFKNWSYADFGKALTAIGSDEFIRHRLICISFMLHSDRLLADLNAVQLLEILNKVTNFNIEIEPLKSNEVIKRDLFKLLQLALKSAVNQRNSVLEKNKLVAKIINANWSSITSHSASPELMALVLHHVHINDKTRINETVCSAARAQVSPEVYLASTNRSDIGATILENARDYLRHAPTSLLTSNLDKVQEIVAKRCAQSIDGINHFINFSTDSPQTRHAITRGIICGIINTTRPHGREAALKILNSHPEKAEIFKIMANNKVPSLKTKVENELVQLLFSKNTPQANIQLTLLLNNLKFETWTHRDILQAAKDKLIREERCSRSILWKIAYWFIPSGNIETYTRLAATLKTKSAMTVKSQTQVTHAALHRTFKTNSASNTTQAVNSPAFEHKYGEWKKTAPVKKLDKTQLPITPVLRI